MGCDIHAVVERRERLSNGEPWGWLNSGDPDIGRNYEVYAALADVRNSDEIVPVSEPKGLPGLEGWSDYGGDWRFPDAPCPQFQEYYERWRGDAHSATWLSLAELKAYDATQEVDDGRLITARHEDGSVASVCRGTSGAHEGPVGRRRIFVWPGDDESKPTPWDRLIAYMENVRAHHDLGDDDVRLVAFFDN